VSPQKRALIEVCVRTKLYIDVLDRWLMSLPSLWVVRRKSVIPALNQRTGLADSLTRQLQAIGLERVAAPVEDLRDYLKRFDSEKASQDGRETGETGDSSVLQGDGQGIALPEDGDGAERPGAA
jgi:hypothetical protein